jgi:hypothetical protein
MNIFRWYCAFTFSPKKSRSSSTTARKYNSTLIFFKYNFQNLYWMIVTTIMTNKKSQNKHFKTIEINYNKTQCSESDWTATYNKVIIYFLFLKIIRVYGIRSKMLAQKNIYHQVGWLGQPKIKVTKSTKLFLFEKWLIFRRWASFQVNPPTGRNFFYFNP